MYFRVSSAIPGNISPEFEAARKALKPAGSPGMFQGYLGLPIRSVQFWPFLNRR